MAERNEQIMLHKWCKLKKLNSWSVPNGGSRNAREAKNLKLEGVTPGVSDYWIMLKDKLLIIELKDKPKRLKSGKMSVSHTKVSNVQEEFIKVANSCSYVHATVAYGFNEAKEFIESHII